MTTQEFSNTFDTLINSYKDIKNFGKTSSAISLELDEYEKSVLLTQALDLIIKSYFDRTLNPQGQGMDDTERRQIDFSELITVAKPGITGMVGGITLRTTAVDTPFTVNPISSTESVDIEAESVVITPKMSSTVQSLQNAFNIAGLDHITVLAVPVGGAFSVVYNPVLLGENYIKYDDRSTLYTMPSNILFMLNEKVISGTTDKKTYVVVPLNYKEYDRIMSKPFSQPLKKQCWRLFQNVSGIDLYSELIPINGAEIDNYIIRYIRRPRPIVLANLTQGEYNNDLSVDGVSSVTECELNPIIHMDILNKAVELALNRIGVLQGGHQTE